MPKITCECGATIRADNLSRHKRGKKHMEHEQLKLKKWVVRQMFAVEAGELDEEKKEAFLTLMEERKDTAFLQECFEAFEKLKTILEKK